jgi:hypothetical protein
MVIPMWQVGYEVVSFLAYIAEGRQRHTAYWTTTAILHPHKPEVMEGRKLVHYL